VRRTGRWHTAGRLAAALVACCLAAAGAAWLVIGPLPPLDSRQEPPAPSTLVLDREGRLLYEVIDPEAGAHRPVPLEEIPLALRQAIVATEDASFYTNPGIDLRGILRAVVINVSAGEIRSGGSTITQQLARNLLLDAEERTTRSWRRKIREAVLAWRLTRALSKDDILALYLNETDFGNMGIGVEAAARVYFDKPVRQLNLAECALLAGLPQSPALYNPLTHPDAARERQRVVLDLMV
jgi:membrane peptidoglycan carboxypeptidase